MGIVSPLGCGVDRVWQRLIAGQSGVRRLPDEMVGDLPAKVAGVVPDRGEDPAAGFDTDSIVSAKDQRKMDRFIPLALAAAQEALKAARWPPDDPAALERSATIIGAR